MNNLAIVRPLIDYLDLHTKIVLRYASSTWFRQSENQWYWERDIAILCKYTSLIPECYKKCRSALLFCYLFEQHIETTWFFDLKLFYHPCLFYYYQLLAGIESHRHTSFATFNRLNRSVTLWYDDRKQKLLVEPSKWHKEVLIWKTRIACPLRIRYQQTSEIIFSLFDIY